MDVCENGDPPPVFHISYARRVRCWLQEKEHV
jgi:hypothetical protein